MDYLTPVLLGIVEGLTEFLPVSSTGHLILASALLGYDADVWATFNVVIQLGAILAVAVVYWRTFWAVLHGLMRREPGAWRFVRNVAIAFVPSALIGVAIHNQIEALLGRADVVAWALIVGGIVILAIERTAKPGEVTGVAAIPLRTVVGIGLIQCISMIPGVSRSGATILGALMLGVERRTAAEFSFFLAIPTMLGATTLEIAKNHDALLSPGAVGWSQIGVGFLVSFVVAVAVIKGFVTFVGRHGFGPFGWYRVVAGVAALLWLNAG
jgi:undecaprenyl-diphosphatase